MCMCALECAWAMDESVVYIGVVAIGCQMLKLRGNSMFLILLCFFETKSCYIDQASLKLQITLPEPLEC